MSLPRSESGQDDREAFIQGLVTMNYLACVPLLTRAAERGDLDVNAVIDEATPRLLAEALNALGSYLRKAGLRGEALVLYETALKSGVDVRLNFANLLAEDPSQQGRARALYEEAWALGDAEALNNLAQLLTNQGDIVHAESLYQKGIQQGDSLAWRNYALFLLEENRVKDAEVQLKALARRHPEVGERPLADLWALLGRWTGASELYRRLDARGAELPGAIRHAVRTGAKAMPIARLRRSLRQSESRVIGSLDYGKTGKSP